MVEFALPLFEKLLVGFAFADAAGSRPVKKFERFDRGVLKETVQHAHVWEGRDFNGFDPIVIGEIECQTLPGIRNDVHLAPAVATEVWQMMVDKSVEVVFRLTRPRHECWTLEEAKQHFVGLGPIANISLPPQTFR